MTERKRNRIYKSPLHPPCREHCNRLRLCLPCGNARSPSVCQQHLSRDLQTQAHLCLREGLNAVNQITYCSNLTKCSLGVTRHQHCSVRCSFFGNQQKLSYLYGNPADAGPKIFAYLRSKNAKVFSSQLAVTRHLNTWLDFYSRWNLTSDVIQTRFMSPFPFTLP
jgi:hypothetical protein